MLQDSLYTFAFIFAFLVFSVGIISFFYSRKKMSAYKDMPPPELENAVINKTYNKKNIFILPGKEHKHSNHPLGAVQTVIRGRIRFIAFGLLFIVISIFALYTLHFTQNALYFERNFFNNLIGTVLFAGGILWGLELIYFSTCSIKLRQTGFEMSSILGSKCYEYNDVDFYLQRTIEHKYQSNGYRPLFFKTANHNFIWECQIIFCDGRKPLIIKSSRYAWLKTKMQKLIDALYNEKQPSPK